MYQNLYDYNNACILVRGDVITATYNNSTPAFKNSTPFTKYIAKLIELQ